MASESKIKCFKCCEMIDRSILVENEGRHYSEKKNRWCPEPPIKYFCYQCKTQIHKKEDVDYCYECEMKDKKRVICKNSCGYRCEMPHHVEFQPICSRCQDPGDPDSDHSLPFPSCIDCGITVCEVCMHNPDLWVLDKSDSKYGQKLEGLCKKCHDLLIQKR